ncbi:VTT domain-containing protein [Paenibacillus sp. GP183]|uniref:VTT domain-containing protein n=1 Tax=Paenibacillus sp. GP183 TaxID=1882751 RepID=UPI00089A0520|nr:VTT domain-containing protein [Paenibacillus sp. GP183]SEB54084.1 membrane protein DedA, SNARE-associated domain [Paenibacillus sp. GP183]
MFHWIIDAFNHHGYLILFLSLFLELLALPLPGELMMGSAGVMVFQGKLSWLGIILAGGAGVSLGMTVSYVIGYRLGLPFFEKYGKYIHFGPDKIERTSVWFEKHGNKLLIAAYYIPGVRHFTGYFSGVTRLSFRSYAIYAYSGAFLWVAVFVTIGKLLGPQWEKLHHAISRYLLIGAVIISLLFLIIFVIKRYSRGIDQTMGKIVRKALHLFHSLARVRLIISLTALFFLGFSLLTIGIIQDFLANEFDQFNEVTMVLISSLQEDFSFDWVQPASFLVSLPAAAGIVILIMVWILIKGTDRVLEFGSLAVTVAGGEIWGELLTTVFHRIGLPSSTSNWGEIGFPSEPTLTAVILYGYAGFLLFRHSSAIWLKTVIIPVLIALLLWVGLNDVLVDKQLPSSVAAGFSFGGVWLTLHIVLLEIFRMLRKPVTQR